MLNNEKLNKVKELLLDMMNEDISDIEIKEVEKTNGTTRTGFVFKGTANVQPVIYVDQWLDLEVAQIANHVSKAYKDSKQDNMDFDWVKDFDKVKENIYYVLLNTKANESMLEHMPHVDILDLSLVFRIAITEGKLCEAGSTVSIPISYQILDVWDISIEELKAAAEISTPKLFKAKVNDMISMLRESCLEIPEEELEAIAQAQMETNDSPQMIVITNESKANGAGAILYPNVCDKICDTYKANKLYLILSSIHECICIPDNGHISPENLNEIITEVNANEVSASDYLSDHCYIWENGNGLQMP